jgi:hypothetical protein
VSVKVLPGQGSSEARQGSDSVRTRLDSGSTRAAEPLDPRVCTTSCTMPIRVARPSCKRAPKMHKTGDGTVPLSCMCTVHPLSSLRPMRAARPKAVPIGEGTPWVTRQLPSPAPQA